MGKHGWRDVSDEDSIAAVRRAMDLGVNLFDTADVYGLGHSEEILAQALGPRRHEVVIATKGGVVWDSAGRTRRDISPRSIRKALEGSLRRLGLETIPLYQLHWPDARTPLAEALGELERCRDEGLLRWIGVCNVGASDLMLAREVSHTVATQFPLSVLDRAAAAELLPFCGRHEMAALTYSPLAQGLLAGAFDAAQQRSDEDVRSRSSYFKADVLPRNVEVARRCALAAQALGITTPQLALSWVLAQPGVTAVLSGIRTAAQVEENVGSLVASSAPALACAVEQAVSHATRE